MLDGPPAARERITGFVLTHDAFCGPPRSLLIAFDEDHDAPLAAGPRQTRQVPISSELADALRPLMEQPQGREYLFGDGVTPLTVQTTHNAIERAFRDSKWKVIKGWHTLRHSFISATASKGVDQRIIDDCVGHCTEEQRRRYRHLFPAVKQKAVASVFG